MCTMLEHISFCCVLYGYLHFFSGILSLDREGNIMKEKKITCGNCGIWLWEDIEPPE